ncbi:hypothetical protein [Streptomyces sp. WAC08241]|uniref:hypothetical protein n=1 Tax=Streptomyces sp. WAC08241 TaxID=2487421 RepID=UPI000F7B20CF|nr:hypothetical protein [Streptomyces sp. WAC08241]RSS38905.1 hypothetical protein EF906_20015 [Streptomyces sp. WAC08241]
MTPDQIAERIAAIHATHPHQYYSKLQPLWRDVLHAIADGAPDAHLLAAAALRTGKPPTTQEKPLGYASVLSLVKASEGVSAAAEAADLGLTSKAIQARRRNALRKLGARDPAHAIEILRERGEITDADLKP